MTLLDHTTPVEGTGPSHPLQTNLPEGFGPSTRAPQQPTLELERLYRKQRLAAAYRLFGRFGFDMGGAGHITARDPGEADHFWVNPAGVHFTRIKVSDLMLVSHSGDIVEGPRHARPLLNRAAFAIHSELHKARPDVVAAAHSHSMYGKAWSATGRLLSALSQDSAAFFEDHVLFREFSGVVLDPCEGQRIARTLGTKNAAILQNHGILTLGQSVEAAAWRYIALENACQIQLIAEAAGQVSPMPDEVARHTRGQVGTDNVAIFAFMAYWDLIAEQEPDLLD